MLYECCKLDHCVFHLSFFKWLYLWMSVSKWDGVKFTVFRNNHSLRVYSYYFSVINFFDTPFIGHRHDKCKILVIKAINTKVLQTSKSLRPNRIELPTSNIPPIWFIYKKYLSKHNLFYYLISSKYFGSFLTIPCVNALPTTNDNMLSRIFPSQAR